MEDKSVDFTAIRGPAPENIGTQEELSQATNNLQWSFICLMNYLKAGWLERSGLVGIVSPLIIEIFTAEHFAKIGFLDWYRVVHNYFVSNGDVVVEALKRIFTEGRIAVDIFELAEGLLKQLEMFERGEDGRIIIHREMY